MSFPSLVDWLFSVYNRIHFPIHDDVDRFHHLYYFIIIILLYSVPRIVQGMASCVGATHDACKITWKSGSNANANHSHAYWRRGCSTFTHTHTHYTCQKHSFSNDETQTVAASHLVFDLSAVHRTSSDHQPSSYTHSWTELVLLYNTRTLNSTRVLFVVPLTKILCRCCLTPSIYIDGEQVRHKYSFDDSSVRLFICVQVGKFALIYVFNASYVLLSF